MKDNINHQSVMFAPGISGAPHTSSEKSAIFIKAIKGTLSLTNIPLRVFKGVYRRGTYISLEHPLCLWWAKTKRQLVPRSLSANCVFLAYIFLSRKNIDEHTPYQFICLSLGGNVEQWKNMGIWWIWEYQQMNLNMKQTLFRVEPS